MLLPADGRCISGAPAMQLQVCDQSTHEWELSFGRSSRLKDALADARTVAQTSLQTLVGGAAASTSEETAERSEMSDLDSITWVFFQDDADKDKTIFTPKKVKAICEMERLVLGHPLYKHFCVLEDSGEECAKQIYSVSAQFYNDSLLNPVNGSCPLLNQNEIDDKRKLINGFFASVGVNTSLPKFDSLGDTNTTRSLIGLGQPLKGFKDGDDTRPDQAFLRRGLFTGVKCPVREIPKYKGVDVCKGIAEGGEIKGVEEMLFERFGLEGVPSMGQFKNMLRTPYAGAKPTEKIEGESDMQVLFYGVPTQQAEFNRVVEGDLNFAVLSIVVVHSYIWFHTRSVFIANFSMFMIVMSLPVGFFFYYNVFGVRFCSQLNVLAIYLALGIGADSVFVAVDSWNQAFVNPRIYTTLGRLNYCMSRTVQACFNTTLTTVMSFIATSFTPVMPIYAFAVFAASVLAVDYLFMIIFAPTWLMLYHVHFSDQGGMCCYCSRSAGGLFKANEMNTDIADNERIRKRDSLYSKCCYAKGVVPSHVSAASFHDRARTEEERLTRIERFFHNRFAPLICGKKPGQMKPFAYLFIALFVGYGAFMIYSALQLTPPTAQEVWFPDYHMFNKDLNTRLSKNWISGADSDYLTLALVFGIETYNRQGTGPSNLDPFIWLFPDLNRGEIIYDSDFDLAREESQRFFIETCKKVGDVKCASSACIGEKLMKEDATVVCVVDAMLEYYNKNEIGNATHAGTATVIPRALFVPIYRKFFTEQQPSWPLDMRKRMYSSTLGMDEGKTRTTWAMIMWRSSMIYPLGNSDAHDGFKVSEDFKNERAKVAPKGMKSVFQTDTSPSGVGWTWLDVEDALVRNLLIGFAVCFPVAFVVLVFATGNIVIAFFAVLALSCVTRYGPSEKPENGNRILEPLSL